MKLPDLPEYARGPTIDGVRYKSPGLSKMQLRAIQREAAIWALEEAEKVCDGWERKNWMYVNGAIRCGADIRALAKEIES